MARLLPVLFGVSVTLLIVISCSSENSVPPNSPPQVLVISVEPDTLYLGDTTFVACRIYDGDGDSLTVDWQCPQGTILRYPYPYQEDIRWVANFWLTPGSSQAVTINVQVSDGEYTDSTSMTVGVFNGDPWYDTGEPFQDIPDSAGSYNHACDPGEIFYDLPSATTITGSRNSAATTDGVYNGPNGRFDDYELFTYPASDTADHAFPVWYTWEDVHLGIHHAGSEWLALDPLPGGAFGWLAYIEGRSTWTDVNRDSVFRLPEYWP